MPDSDASATFLSTPRGRATLALLCTAAFLDFVDASIVNVALPSIREDLHFSVQSLQWVVSGYLLTYGGFLMLGGRAADLLGRRRILLAGTTVFALASLAGGLAQSEATLVGARLVQGIGAAMMSPAALSILTTSFHEGRDRNKALGAWGAMAGLGSAVGVFVGGVLAEGPGWRWVLFVNLPFCVAVIVGAVRLLSDERPAASRSRFDAPGALLATAAMLLLVYTLVEAPDAGWGTGRTIGGLAGAAALFVLFVFNERRHPDPLVPLSIFRIEGLAAADGAMVAATAGFLSMFFFVTLYMQNVLGFSQIEAGAAYLPVTLGVGIASGIAAQASPRVGTRPVIVAGALVGAGGIYWLSRFSADGSYVGDLLAPLIIMSLGLGAVFVGVQTAANAGVPPHQAGLAAALVNTSTQLGGALGLAVFSAIATSHTNNLLSAGTARPEALTAGFQRALVAASMFLIAAAIVGLRATDTRAAPDEATTDPTAMQPQADVA